MTNTSLIYVPGFWRCAKCEFTLVQKTLNASDGTVSADDNPGQKCPNCDSPLWRVSWKDHAEQIGGQLDTTWDELTVCQKDLAERDATVAALVDALLRAGERLDASQFTNAEHSQAKNIMNAALETTKPAKE